MEVLTVESEIVVHQAEASVQHLKLTTHDCFYHVKILTSILSLKNFLIVVFFEIFVNNLFRRKMCKTRWKGLVQIRYSA